MPAQSASRRILVLDDDEVVRTLLEALLAADGHAVTLADSGEAGVHALERDPTIELVLTDLHMPGLRGAALATALRAVAGSAVLLAMSAAAPDEATLACFDGFVPKPFDLQTLRKAEQEALDHQAERTSAAQATQGDRESVPVPPLDEAIFHSLARMVPLERLGELYAMILEDVRKRHARMVAAAAEGKLLTVKQEAHATKGACGMVGAIELAKLSEKIEVGSTISTSALAEIPAACRRLERMLEAALK